MRDEVTNRYHVQVTFARIIDAPNKEEAAEKARDLMNREDIRNGDYDVELEERNVGDR